MVLDLFSRMIVGWLLAERESAELAEHLFAETVARHGIQPGALTVHADRGSAMRSEGLVQLLGGLGVERSFSRPRVSDDNAFSEWHFKTLKYQPDYPDRFASPTHGRAWCQEFFGWYNDDHQHSGLALFTPADVFYGRVEDVAARRQVALDAVYAAHPERAACRASLPPRWPSIYSLSHGDCFRGLDRSARCRDHFARGRCPAGDQLAVEASRSLALGRRDPELAALRDPFIEFSRELSQSRWHFPH